MMESSSLEEKIIIKDIRNLFRLTKKIDDTTTKGIRNLFRQVKQLKIEQLAILGIILGMKKIIINQ